MTVKSISRIVVPSVALVAACGAALVFGIVHVGREPPLETRPAAAASAVSPPASRAIDESSTALAKTQAEANAVAAELAVSPPPPAIDESVPAFDIARIERTGEAVIAGRAAPGAMVELLRNGERLDGATADRSGQFVMVPPRLPPGDYQLTLRSRLPDGTLATSRQGVPVALAEAESGSDVDRSSAAVPFNVPKTAATNVAVSELPRATAAARPLDGGSSSAVAEPKTATTVVSRGDSLWRISRLTYGVGTRYALVYRANRDRIRDPNRIYPGQTFVLPSKAH
jgi:nucleoid-associated protein YgaU